MNRLVIGILAHVDAGKTTLSEAMLFIAGNIKKLGRVDHKDAFLDNYGLERERGITIFSKQAIMTWKDIEIALLDTPGHVDFSTEMERTLNVLDYAVLVISATDGVQPHTKTLWKLLKRYNIPTFIFVNKMDISDRGRDDITEELQKKLDDNCINFLAEKNERFYENMAITSERALDIYMQTGTITDDNIREFISKRKVFPCYFGSALKMQGIEEFMNEFYYYYSPIKYGTAFGAKVYKIARDGRGVRLTYLKITGGSLSVKEQIEGTNGKVGQIRLYSGAKYKILTAAQAGMVCAVTGLKNTYSGENLGVQKPSSVPMLEPVFAYRIVPENETDCHKLLGYLRILEEEDPQIHIVWNEKLQEISIQLMGEVQLEVIQKILSERFGINTSFGKGNIVYKETITDVVEGIGHFEPLRHYAEVHLLLEAGDRGSGLVFDSDCSEENLSKNWQRLILSHLSEKEHTGVLTGSVITDIKITLVTGKAHLKHTVGGDFRQAAYRAVRQGLMQANNRLLEPYYNFRLDVPAECIGRAMTDIKKMKGSFIGPAVEGDMQILSGIAPVSTMSGYMTQVSAYTKGKGSLLCNLKGYMPCHNEKEILEKTTYNPDEDAENPSGSIFCAHGAGFYVPWYEVYNYMHLDKVMIDDEGHDLIRDITEIARRYNDRYSGTIEEDKELEAIFERTFGSVGRRLKSDTTGYLGHEKSDKKKQNTDEEYLKNRARYENKKNRNKKTQKSYLLVDGYNIIFSWKELNDLSKISLDAARGRLMDILCNYQGYTQCTLILVFDAYKVKGNTGTFTNYHNIYVVYTKEAETADMYIEKVTHEIGKKHNVTVATSDVLEQMIVSGDGAKKMSAEEFEEEVKRVTERINEIIQ